MNDDGALLCRYAAHRDQAAFAELVARHLDTVYAIALRQVGGDAHLARDVSQLVFTKFAREARALAGRPVIAGWLYRAAQFASIDTVRMEARRRAREKKASLMPEASSESDALDPDKIRPLLDRAIGELCETDRDAVVLRFLHGQSFASVGATLRLNENAARMRVDRALEKLRARLARHGITSTGGAVAAALAAQAAPAPTGLAGAITGQAMLAAAGASTFTAAGILISMNLGKVTLLANVILVGALAVQPSLAPPSVRNFLDHHLHRGVAATATTVAASEKSAVTAGAAVAKSNPRLGETFPTGDLPALTARLRAAGFPAPVVVQIIRRQIDAHYDAKAREITDLTPGAPFWKSSLTALATDPRRSEQLAQLQREREKTYRDMVNDPFFFNDAALDIGQRRMWGDLPRAKLDRIQKIEDDYTEMMSAVRMGANGVLLTAEHEKLEFLQREKQVDIIALLSPEELAEYQLRTRSVDIILVARTASFAPTEGEWRAVAQAHRDLNARSSALGGPAAATREFEAHLRYAIGDARYADYVRTTNPDYRQIGMILAEAGLPATTTAEAFHLRDRIAIESNRIFDDSQLDLGQKRTALKSLGQNARAQLQTLLAQSSSAHQRMMDTWFGPLANGSAIAFGGLTAMQAAAGKVVFVGASAPTLRRLPDAADSAR